ncbi:MAG: hypothetical protein CMN85_10810 [Spongiibacteraceae bacterium]|uniref:hypothetical protein n=1 Tax=uncultured Haliea sp. TaxID=622616 RepID=UPI000C58BBD5|nr:hypothetical protein [Spongiibacteraceae bacterium]|tara:strand:+ start:9316 stop:10203 length:888 start_codon:yes stop_codon:yes gene_type:complete
MAFQLADMVRETTQTGGTGTYSLGGAIDRYQTFVDGVGDGNSTYYSVISDSDFEIGIGTVAVGSPDTLSRDTVLASSNADAAVSWPASGTRTVITCYPTGRNALFDNNQDLTLLRDLILARHILLGTTTTQVQGQASVSNIIDFIAGAGGSIDVRVGGTPVDRFPSGTRMLFQQTTPPTGWTKETGGTYDDTALRIVTGAVGSRTATSAFSTVFGKTATDGHTLTVAQMPVHNHTQRANEVVGVTLGTGASALDPDPDTMIVTAGSTANAGSGNAHSHNMDIRVNYHDVVIAAKD